MTKQTGYTVAAVAVAVMAVLIVGYYVAYGVLLPWPW